MADALRSLNPLATLRCIAALVAASLLLVACGNDPSQSGNASTPTLDASAASDESNDPERHSQDAARPDMATGSAPASSMDESPASADLVRVIIKGEAFDLEPALNQTTRYRGLGGRASLPERGGMIFAFPFSERLEFVMRDCLIDIDIAYLNNDGRVVSMHTMINEPREPGESDSAYEERLTRYPSQFPARFAVEVRGGLLRELGLEVGDVLEFDRGALKARAR